MYKQLFRFRTLLDNFVVRCSTSSVQLSHMNTHSHSVLTARAASGRCLPASRPHNTSTPWLRSLLTRASARAGYGPGPAASSIPPLPVIVDTSTGQGNRVELKGTAAGRASGTAGAQAEFPLALHGGVAQREVIKVAASGPLAQQLLQHLNAGATVYVEGRLRCPEVVDPTTMAPSNLCTVLADKVSLVDAPAAPEAPAAPQPQRAAPEGFQQRAPVSGFARRKEEEANWDKFRENPKAFWDNRFNKRNPKAPDFKQKDGDIALWLTSYNKPDWIDDFVAEMDRANPPAQR